MRESAQSWHELLVDLKARGLVIAPELATATARSAFGKRSRRPRRQQGTSAARCTRPPTYSTSCPSPCSRPPSPICARSGRRTSNPIESVFATVPAPRRPHQGRAVGGYRPVDGVQAGDGRRENLASAEGRKPLARGRRGRHLHQRRRDHQRAKKRRLITASPRFLHSSDS